MVLLQNSSHVSVFVPGWRSLRRAVSVGVMSGKKGRGMLYGVVWFAPLRQGSKISVCLTTLVRRGGDVPL